MVYHAMKYTRDNISNRNGALGIAFLALAKMVTLNHLREGGKARAGQKIKGRVRMVMQGGLELLVDEMLDEAAEAEEARRARVEQERAAAEQERQRRAAEGLPAADGDGADRCAKTGPDHDARLLAVVLSLANSGYLSKACARFSYHQPDR